MRVRRREIKGDEEEEDGEEEEKGVSGDLIEVY